MKILIVDDEKALCIALSSLLKHNGYDTIFVNSFDECLSLIKKDFFEIIILDYQLKGRNGLELLSIIKRQHPLTQVILITAFGNENLAITAIKTGAYDYVKKPFDNDELINRVNHIKESFILKSEITKPQDGYFFSVVMNSIIEKVKTLSKTDVPVLLTGESGTGKEIIAKMIHKYSERTGNFIPVNCSAIPENLIESALFGAEKGSFTGAGEKKIGFFESADNGTIFLDEIGEINLDLQTKFLRVLQENEITRVGGNLPVKIRTRVISATNKNIENEVLNNKFREDLFYRLNVIRIHIPPLRERKDEIKSLALVFLKDFSKKYEKNIIGFDKKALDYFQKYEWPGNIRELKNTVEKLVIFSKKEWIEINDLQNENTLKGLIRDDKNMIDNLEYDFKSLPVNITQAKRIISSQFEKEFIMYYLKKNNFNITRTGKQIGLHRQDLYKKMKELEISTDMYEKK